MRPALQPGLSPLRRDPGTVQVGVDPGPALIIGGLDPAVAEQVLRLDGAHAVAELRQSVARRGADPAGLDAVLTELAQRGLLARPDGSGPEEVVETVVAGETAARLARERRAVAWVEVRGGDRVGVAVAALLRNAGAGHVTVVDPHPTEPWEPGPGGLEPDDVGLPRGPAAERLARRAAPAGPSDTAGPGDPGAPPRPTRPDLVVLAPGAESPRALAADLVRRGLPHLVVRVGAGAGTVGPLVLPTRSSCLRCHDLHRADRDPGWPDVAEQADRRHSVAPCPATLAWALAALAAQQVAVALGGGRPTTVDATLDVALPELLPRRRSWRPHPACGCGWAEEA